MAHRNHSTPRHNSTKDRKVRWCMFLESGYLRCHYTPVEGLRGKVGGVGEGDLNASGWFTPPVQLAPFVEETDAGGGGIVPKNNVS